ncbi:hypothetical protein [Okeania sp.]|nr:hypothetical protein [Okeania sp.]MEB3340426.1 hypothetical protein [Okeania sp.]
MTRKPLLDRNRSYTFSNYFESGFTVDDLVTEYGKLLTFLIRVEPG